MKTFSAGTMLESLVVARRSLLIRKLRRPFPNMTAETLVSKLWNYCNVLRDDGLSFRLRRASAFTGLRRDESARQDGNSLERQTFWVAATAGLR